MAIFASTTTSGYSDPLKALTIKALEKRQADQLAQSQQAEPPIQTIPGGVGHVLGVIGDKMQSERTAQALADQKNQLAQTMAGIDWEKGPSSQQIASMGSADPDTMRQVLSTMAENRRAAAADATTRAGQDKTLQGVQGGHEVTREGQKITKDLGTEGHTIQRAGQQLQLDLADKAALARRDEAVAERNWKGAQAELDRAEKSGDRQAVITAQKALQEAQQAHDLLKQKNEQTFTAAQPKSDAGKVASDAGIPLTPAQAAKVINPDPKAAEVAKGAELEQQLTQKNLMVNELTRAEEALKGGINTGPWAGAQTALANVSGGYLGDKDQAQRTTLFDNTMNKVATGAMSNILKGQSTDFEMKKFIAMYNNPNIAIEAKRAAFSDVLAAAKKDRDIEERAVKKIGGDTSRPGEAAAPAAAAAADPLEGRTANGPDGPIIRRNGKWEKQ